MAPQPALKAITANRLADGAVVWFGPGSVWVDQVADAALFEDDAAGAALAAAQDFVRRNLVLDAYAIEVALIDGKPVPTRYREVVRARGPSIRTDLGKQAAA